MRKSLTRRLIRIFIASIILIFTISLQSFADSSFRLKFQDGKKLKAGETIEIPIIVDNINIEGVEKKIFTFSGTLNYNDEVFELVPYEIDGKETFIKTNEEIEEYGLNVWYNAEDGKIKTSLTQEYIGYVKDNTVEENNMKYLNNMLTLGTMKFKAKEDAKAGNYQVYFSNVEANNSEFTISSNTELTQITIYEDAKEQEEAPEQGKDESNYNKVTKSGNSKKAILTIEVSEDGKNITIAPDEVNGAVIKAITYNNKELAKENGVFVFESEPNKIYKFLIYGLNEGYLGNEYISTEIKAKEDSKEDNNKRQDNVDKSPQTGDEIYYISAMLLVALGSLCITIRKK